MIFPLYIARRYLVSKKSHNLINVITWVSVAGVTIGTMALIIILSVFNGFEGLVTSLFHTFQPDLKIELAEGKTFSTSKFPMEGLHEIPGVAGVFEVVEENALVRYEDKQHIVLLKGMGPGYDEVSGLHDYMIAGDFTLGGEGRPFASIGAGVAYRLGLYLGDRSRTVQVFMPKRLKKTYTGLPDQSFNNSAIAVTGVFAVQQEFDESYMVVPASFVRSLLDYSDEVTSLDVMLAPEASASKVAGAIKERIGDEFMIRDRFMQQELLYRVMRTEKWAIFAILAFVLLIAAFNVIGSLSMLMLDKRKDISVLWSMGASRSMIRRIFIAEGMLISVAGGVIGLLLGGLLAFLQQEFGFIRLGGGEGTYIVDTYPVEVEWRDFIYVLITVLLIGALTVWYPVRQISRKYLSQRLNFFLMR